MYPRSCITAMLTTFLCLWGFGAALFSDGAALAADNDLVEMIVELVRGSDMEMRNLGLEQVREQAPGKTATRRFAQLLPGLSPDVQLQLLDALADRGDAAACPEVREMLNGETEAVRAMAARALGRLGDADDVSALVRLAAAGADAEKQAVSESLRQLRGRKVDDAIVKTLRDVGAGVRVELIAVLAARGARDALPDVLRHAEDSDPAVRQAVLRALREMGDHRHARTVVKMLKSAQDRAEHGRAESALIALCGRGREKSAAAVIEGFKDAAPPVRVSLLRGLAEAGDKDSLKEVVARLKDEDEDVRGEAVRVLADWPDAAAAPYLKELAARGDNPRNHVLAIRGLVRLASPAADRGADLTLLAEAMALATRTEEKTLVLGTLGTIVAPESLALAVGAMDRPELREDAALSAVNIAEKLDRVHKDEIRIQMQKVAETVQDSATRERAAKVLEML